MPGVNGVASRPAETAGVASALALLIARLLGVDDADTIVALGIVIGFVPAGVTAFVVAYRKARAPGGG
jgi:hypothetical protein